MSITYMKGDLLEDSGCDYICHQVNCQGAMNSGIAKSIKEKWPIVSDLYYRKCAFTDNLLGNIQIVNVNNEEIAIYPQYVINMFSQEYYGYDGKRYTSYDAFWNCLHLIKQQVPKDKVIGFPYKIGCVRGGANWSIIYAMIAEVLKDYEVEIWEL